MSMSVCLSVCLSAVLSRLYFKDYSSDRFWILYGDSTYLEDVQRCSLDWKNWKLSKSSNFENVENLWAFPTQCALLSRLIRLFIGSFSNFICRFYILILQILKMSSVVVLIEKVENCQDYLILKIYEDFVQFPLNVHFCPGCFSKTVRRIIF